MAKDKQHYPTSFVGYINLEKHTFSKTAIPTHVPDYSAPQVDFSYPEADVKCWRQSKLCKICTGKHASISFYRKFPCFSSCINDI